MKELIVAANIENLERVQDFVRAELSDCPAKIKNQLAIAVDEVFSNITNYAGTQEGDTVSVRILVGDEVILEFADAGIPYNPLEKADPELDLGLDQREVGGLGIFLVKSLMDSLEYRHEGGLNVLTLRKKV